MDQADLRVADRLVADVVQLVRLLRRTGPAVRGLDGTSLPVLIRLATEGPRRSGELAAAMCADPSTVSRQVAGLVRAGLVERRADPGDGRASLLAVTDHGYRVLDHERRTRADRLAEALADWAPEDRERFAEQLGRFVSDLRKMHERESL